MTSDGEYKGAQGVIDYCLDLYPEWKRDFTAKHGRPPTDTDMDKLEDCFEDWLREMGWPGTKPTAENVANRKKYGGRTFKEFVRDGKI